MLFLQLPRWTFVRKSPFIFCICICESFDHNLCLDFISTATNKWVHSGKTLIHHRIKARHQE